MDEKKINALQDKSARNISDLFKNHGVDCSVEENEIFFNKEQIRVKIYCLERNSDSNQTILQLDVLIYYGINPIVESFAGVGKDFETANVDAFENFTRNSFHAILSAFFTPKYDEQIQKYNWIINDKQFDVYINNIGLRGDVENDSILDWFNQFEVEIKNLEFEEGVHWIRLYYAQQHDKTISCEVLLDNEPCLSILPKAEKFDWHRQEEFYSVRVFMVLKTGIDFGRVVKLIGSELEYEDLFSNLEQLRLSEVEIEKSYSFIPEAFGRKLIQDLGVKGDFSDEAVIKNNNQREFKIDLKDEQSFEMATQLVNKLTKDGWSENLKRIAFTSASFNAFNEALNSGVELEEINCSCFRCVFEIPHYSGLKPNEKLKRFWKIW